MKIKSILLGTALAVVSFAVLAQAASAPATPGVDKRQAKQEKRIEKGKASGELTAREARRLERQQNRIETAEANAKADGKVTKAERAKLQARQTNASRNIHHQKHDAQAPNNKP